MGKTRRAISLLLSLVMVLGLMLPVNLVGSSAVAAAGVSENLLENGGFEAGDLSGWNTGGNEKFSVVQDEVRSGAYALQVTGPQAWNGIKYTVSVSKQTDYTLSFFAKGKGGAAYKVLKGSNEDVIAEGYTGDQAQWTEYSLAFNSGQNESVIIYVSDASDLAYYDDFTLISLQDDQQESENLVRNGDFEAGDLSAWSVNDTTIGGVKFTVSSTERRNGEYALKLESEAQIYDGIKNTVTVSPNTDYTFSFYAKGAGGSYFKVLSSDESVIYESQTTTTPDWSKYRADFNSGENSSVIIYVSDMTGVAYFDDFIITKKVIPQEPSVQNVSVAGAAKVGHKLTGQYDYQHPHQVSEGYSIHTWLQADSVDGEYEVIPESYHEPTFVLTEAQIGKYIKFEVTPLDSEGLLGASEASEAIGPIEALSLLEELLLEIERAEALIAGAVEGDAIGQYPTSAFSELELAIEAASDAVAGASGDDQLEAQIAAMIAAQSSFEQARVKKPSQLTTFITAEGDKLMDGTEEFRFISFNYPGALFNEDEQGGIMPSAFEMEDAIRTAKQTGGKVLRTYTLTVKKPSHSSSVVRHIMGPGELNEEAFLAMDKLLELANDYGVRLIIPFFDHWDWPPGGISDLAAFRGIIDHDIKNKAAYSNPVLIKDYQMIMDKVMNRINTLTGVRYKDDPAILAWETGNELMVAPEWEKKIAAHYKKINSNQLLVNGNQIHYPNATNAHSYVNITETGLTDPNFDIVKSHYYSGNYALRVIADKELVAGKKPFFVGEFGLKPPVEIEATLNSVIENNASGALLWSLRPHSYNGGFVRHNEYDPGNGIVYSAYHWPGLPSGDYQGSTAVLSMMREKAYEIDGLEVPPMPAPEPAPELFESDAVSKLRWRGSTGASSYIVERAESIDGPWTVVGQNILDDVVPGENMFSDLTAETGKSYYYRVKGVNSSGESEYSSAIGPITAKYVLVDNLENKSKQYYADDESIVYRTPSAIVSFSVTASGEDFSFYISNDGLQFAEVMPTKADGIYHYVLDSEELATELKIVYPDGHKSNGNIVNVSIEYLGNGTVLTPIKPLINDGVIVDEMINFASMSGHSDNLQFASDLEHMAGGDQSRLVRTNEETAYVQYRSLGDMSSFKLETYYSDEPTEEQFFTVLGSSNGIEFTELDVEVRALGGEWYKTNYEIERLPEHIRFLKIVYPADDQLSFPQISRLQIGVGTGMVSFPVEPPAAIIDDGEYYGGESLLVNRAYTKDNGVEITLDNSVKSAGEFGLKINFELDDATSASVSATKSLTPVDRSAYDTLQFWVKPDGYERKLIVELETADQKTWRSEVEISGIKGYYVNLPIKADMSQLSSFTLTVEKGNGSASGTIYLDDIRFIQTKLIDSFDNYEDESQFAARYSRTSPVGNLALSLDADNKHSGSHSLKIDYDFKSDGYGGVITSLPYVDWSNYDGIQLWLDPNGVVATFVVQVKKENNEYFETSIDLDGSSNGRLLKFLFSDFDYPSWYGSGGVLDPKDIVEFNIYLNQISGTPATGTIYVDQIEVVSIGNGGGGSTPGGGQTPIVDETEAPKDGRLVLAQLQANESGKIVIELKGKTTEVIVPASSTAINGSNSIVLKGDEFELEIPAQILEALKSLLSEQELADGAQLVFELEELGAAGVEELLKRAEVNGASVKAVTGGYSFVLEAVTKDGREVELAELPTSMKLQLAFNHSADAELIGVYLLDDEGKLQYVGGTVAGNEVIAPAESGHRYVVLEYNKEFADVGVQHWASHAIKVLAAKHIVTGVNDAQFQPNNLVTRAEFVAMLARALGLQASDAPQFSDVANDKWYAASIAAASEAGIVSGRGDGMFAPEAMITREEMAVLVMRAFEAKTNQQAADVVHADSSFADQASISAWAQQYIQAAAELGLIQGRSNNQFAPKANASRAESALIIYRLISN